MDPFRIPVEPTVTPWKTGYGERHVFIGSCFTENIGNRMAELKFSTDINPFGILYNPESISQCIRRLVSPVAFTEEELFFHDGLWHSFMHHGQFSSVTPAVALRHINDRLFFSSEYLKQAGFLFLTFGTAWVFEYKPSGTIVSNCHKLPSVNFARYRLSPAEIADTIREALEALWGVNASIKVILTVSPVRHLQDGAIANQLGKAALLLAADALCRGFGNDRILYFPSYELVMDELRDYRFYADDMVHISPVAVNYIWEKFCEALITAESKKLMEEILHVLRAKEHRPIHAGTPEHRAFLMNSLKKVLSLSKKNPYLDLSEEKRYFEKQIYG
jgi:hypothetical protein